MLERRDKGQRRWGLDAGFPLKDDHDNAVMGERRRRYDRRLENNPLEQRLMMLCEMTQLDPGQK